MKRLIPVLILFVSLLAAGLVVVGSNKKIAPKEAPNLAAKQEQDSVSTDTVASKVADEKVTPVKILFVGDMMFDRYIRQTTQRKGAEFVLAGVRNILTANDLVVGNLEGPITDSQSVSVDSKMGERNNYVFTFDSKVSALLAGHNIKLVNLGNNHILNFGAAGLAQTKTYLTQGGVAFFGDPVGEKRIAMWNKNGLRLAFVTYNQFESEAKVKALADIQAAKGQGADLVILYTHWGTEFVGEPEQKIKDLAHELVDAGADLIIGSHPHVVQSKEQYQGKMIYYSLGNFIFDQYFSPETQKGLAVQLEIGADRKLQLREFEVQMKSTGQTVQAN